MTLSRRSMILAPVALAPVAFGPVLFSTPARAQDADPRLGDRSVGKADAKVAVLEYFSLTCPHCAAFHKDVWPRVKQELVGNGTVRMVWRDFPLDQLALAAAQVARALPADRYEGFISALLASQDRWAFARGADNVGEIAKIAALAGMTRAQVDAAVADQALARGILEMRAKGQQEFNINSTPTFVFGRRPQPGAVSFERFQQLANDAA
ncbi:thioredoxin domain-containing protein [Roseomonas aerophila]|uniref:Thioredoxin domain-containing protein n=1 Tax=Teichococcus aerophilus TaxID=1224513 RepID=A0ABR7RSE0_9PROT|nr:thioredoxin domain-containing protein [Pseudoroseomonas aerophila]MBC9209555.1 thioredoxin domain-containing protein [Pseudoroseomonas aerophila]